MASMGYVGVEEILLNILYKTRNTGIFYIYIYLIVPKLKKKNQETWA